MTLDLVIDIGNSRIKGAIVENDAVLSMLTLPSTPFPKEQILAFTRGKSIEKTLISSNNPAVEQLIFDTLKEVNIPTEKLNHAELKLKLDIDDVGQDRIANCYGALSRFPLNDCVIVDMGTVMTCDLVTKDGRYLGGMVYPIPNLHAKPSSPLGTTRDTQLQSGIYYGLLGTIERLIAELSMAAESPSSIKVIATGGAHVQFTEDLQELVDLIDPNLTLVGLYEILKEKRR